ncbi:hypothetical protein [Paenibacillus alkalitolerans]|uniref:hypothetical protein n=1 Tax=Paenibacillus alkalitolerans TaxID=2799335 RepID=UPI0018F6BB52|nr:hypothetical protein [Paenibacillus alkalitolerans]
MAFNFKQTRQRIQELTFMYRRAKHAGDEMACWALWAEIEELEREISEAHKGRAIG